MGENSSSKRVNKSLYCQSLALLTDLYQLTMAYGYWKAGFDQKEAVFHLSTRKHPFQGGFTVCAGLELAIDYLNSFAFDPSDLAFLASMGNPHGTPIFSEPFLHYLSDLKFSCDIDAIPEGTIVFPHEPLVRVQGPLIQAQLLETILLNLVNFSSLIATKAARICVASQGDPVMEFGLRRAQGIDGGLTASRAAYIGGCDSTSNVLAGKIYGIPVKGTHSHSWVMVFDDELEAFMTYAKHLPDNCIFLVDTYNTLEGIERAIEAAEWLRKQGKKMLGIRLDSGDLACLSIRGREMLDRAGFPEAKIFATNTLDEDLISDLKRQGAQIFAWGVGTRLTTGHGQSALDGVYKLSAIRDPGGRWKYKLKLSEQMLKVSNPGILQVRRYSQGNENVADVIYDVHTDVSEGCTVVDPLDPTRRKILPQSIQGQDLLVPIFRKGEQVYQVPDLSEVQAKTRKELNQFHASVKRFLNPHSYVAGLERSLYNLKIDLIHKIRDTK